MSVSADLSELNGIGKARLEALRGAGICTLRDLLYALPASYKDTANLKTVAEARPGERAALKLRREGAVRLSFHGRLSRVTCDMRDDTGRVSCRFFNQPWMRDVLSKKTDFTLYGMVELAGGKKRLTNPSMEDALGISPVYKPIPGLPGKTRARIVSQALAMLPEACPETLPEYVLNKYNLMGCADALRAAHSPDDMDELREAQKRFAFEKLLLYLTAVRLMRRDDRRGAVIPASEKDIAECWAALPFKPTGAQRRTLSEIARDMASKRAMARMVQGDVGSGKTAVAFGAMRLCAEYGYQAALMAPTEILARQHFESAKRVFGDISCGLFTGGMHIRERREALRAIAGGEWRIIIGTHALISRDVEYSRLGLCVTDEQHRFGVGQRTRLINKAGGESANLLVMSATPIPRSLALVLYGDLDISVVDEKPPGRTPVSTRVVPESKRGAMYGFLRERVTHGEQAYIVCPLVEDSEEMAELKSAREHFISLSEGPLKGLSVGLTHGRQTPAEKESVLMAFASGKTQVLVATTVIEVGVDVPNATIMIIESAERYGLSQLHQLRGRVGRGGARSWCFLMGEMTERLSVLTKTNDGFEISREDLRLRGPGEFLGERQHGLPELPSGVELLGDGGLIHQAAACVSALAESGGHKEAWEALVKGASEMLGRVSERVSLS